ncbi:hypothetical protein IWQ57_003154, partial [Coemansia nantahalensis]
LHDLLGAVGLLLGMAAHAAADPIYVGYYQTWKAEALKETDLSKYTHVDVSFGIPQPNGTITMDFDLAPIVKSIHDHNAKALLSVGGWTGSGDLSAMMKESKIAAALIKSIVELIEKYELDGIDIDWEHPGREGATKNFDEEKDMPNFMAFLDSLRKVVDTRFGAGEKLITLAVYGLPFRFKGKEMTDLAEVAKSVDYANIMLYDFYGFWSNMTGPNAGVNPSDDKKEGLSFMTGINAWIGAKWPANKLVAGMPFYGRALTATEDMLQNPTNIHQSISNVVPRGDEEDVKEELPKDAPKDQIAQYSGMWQWKHLSKTILPMLNDPESKWTRQWDDVSQTPWLFNSEDKTFITYDDPECLKIKSQKAAAAGLAGAMVWAMDMDSGSELIDVIRESFNSPPEDNKDAGNGDADPNNPVGNDKGDTGEAGAPGLFSWDGGAPTGTIAGPDSNGASTTALTIDATCNADSNLATKIIVTERIQTSIIMPCGATSKAKLFPKRLDKHDDL